MRPIRRIVIHHSASLRDVTRSQIDRWHRERGFDQIGYHYVIEEKGNVERGRAEYAIGAHCRGANLDSIGICVVGDNTRPGCEWVGPQWVALLNLLLDLRTRFPGVEVLGHRDVPGAVTECPGIDIRPILASPEPLRAAHVIAAGD